MNIAPAGDRALLMTSGRIPAPELYAAAVRIRSLPQTMACIVGEESLYVIFRGVAPPTSAFEWIMNASNGEQSTAPRQHSIRVSFADRHALDLPGFLTHAGLARSDFLERLREIRLTARFLGFRAGFAYLDGWPAEWRMPRRPTSRSVVPRGSFAIAGEMAGFYPIDTPGGWNILACTDALLWDPTRTPPNLFGVGDDISLMPTDDVVEPPVTHEQSTLASSDFEIISGGHLATWVSGADYGRIDYGLAPGGPFDEMAAAAANGAVGNPADAALLECAMVGPRIRFRRRRVVAWAGAPSSIPSDRPHVVEAGHELNIGRLRGMRGYLAVGDDVRGGGFNRREAVVHQIPDVRTIAIANGPHDAGLQDVECEVTPQMNRVGIRMRPLTPIGISAPADLKSCGMQFGTLQLHPDGSIVAMGPDHPLTGGYLQPLTVLWNERWKLGQLAPGDRVRFLSVYPERSEGSLEAQPRKFF